MKRDEKDMSFVYFPRFYGYLKGKLEVTNWNNKKESFEEKQFKNLFILMEDKGKSLYDLGNDFLKYDINTRLDIYK